jgi:hypothetical protein
VICRPEPGLTASIKGETEVMDYLEFIARVTSHIPMLCPKCGSFAVLMVCMSAVE